jgi:hypothetical protein
MALENTLLARISALNVATEFLVPNISASSRPVIIKWLKADLAALEQLRKQMKREERETSTAPGGAYSTALSAIIQAKYEVLNRLDKKKTLRTRKSTTSRTPAKKNGTASARPL